MSGTLFHVITDKNGQDSLAWDTRSSFSQEASGYEKKKKETL